MTPSPPTNLLGQGCVTLKRMWWWAPSGENEWRLCLDARKKRENIICFPLRFTFYLHKAPQSLSLLAWAFFYYLHDAKPWFKHPSPALFSTVKQVSSKIQREAKKFWTIHYYARSSFYHCSNGWGFTKDQYRKKKVLSLSLYGWYRDIIK